MDGEKETVSVKWWNHRSALCRSIRDIYMKNLYTDVKLVCEGQEYWVHKFVLSACSEYFETVLGDVPFQGSIALAPSVRSKELLSLLDFMYLGIVDVLQHELPSLVAAAEVLMIRGLAIPYEDEDSEEEILNPKGELSQGKSSDGTKYTAAALKKGSLLAGKRKRSEEIAGGEQSVKVEDESFEYCTELEQTSQMGASTSNRRTVWQRSPDQNCQVTSSNAEVNAMLKVLIGKSPKVKKKQVTAATPENQEVEKPGEGPKVPTEPFVCSTCKKTFQWRSNLTKHLRTHTGEKPYGCNHCTYRTSYSEALKRHVRIHTGEKPYQCEYCDYKSRDHGSLKIHLRKHVVSTGDPPPVSDTQQNSNLVIPESVSSSNLMAQGSGNQQKLVDKDIAIVSHVNYGNDSQVNYVHDSQVNYAKDSQVNYAKDSQANYAKDSQVNYAKDSQVNYAKDSQVNYAKDPHMNYAKDSQVNYAKDSHMNYAKDSQVNYAKDSHMNYAKGSQVNYAKDSQVNYVNDPHVKYEGVKYEGMI